VAALTLLPFTFALTPLHHLAIICWCVQHYYYYHLWHPLDHVEAAWALGPKVPFVQKGMPIYTLIHERYR
jgi:hypothetical protein